MQLTDIDEPVRNQLGFGEKILKLGKPVFGSCWGLQINIHLLGGKIRTNPLDTELGVSRNIQLSDAGIKHPIYQGKPACFDALSVHTDEVESLPQHAVILASNHHSNVQAVAYQRQGANFIGVQYHPEFTFGALSNIFKRIEDDMIEKQFCRNQADFQALVQDYEALHASYHQENAGENGKGKQRKDLLFHYGITPSVTDLDCHRLEIKNWLDGIAETKFS